MNLKGKSYKLLLVPALLLILLFLVVPILRIMYPTFFKDGALTLSYYTDFLTDPFYLKIYIRTIRIAVITSVICAVFSLPVAFYISRMNISKKGIMIALATFPLLTNSVVRAFAWITILGKEGIINNIFMNIGVISEPMKILYTENAIIIGSVYLFLPIMLTSLVGVMDNITDEIVEAASSLGANGFISFLKIIIPLSTPGLIVGSVLVFAGTASAYSTPLMLGGNKNMMMSTLIYQQAMLLDNWTRAAVISTIMIVTSYFVVSAINKLADRIGEKSV